MATTWDDEMTDRFDQLQRALTDEIRNQFVTLGGQLEERLQTRLGERLEARLEKRIGELGEQLEQRLGERLEERLDQRLGERLEERLDQRLGELEERLDQRLGDRLEQRLGARLEERIDQRMAAGEERLTAHISHTMQVQGESLRDIVKMAADNCGGVLGRIDRELGEFRQEWRTQTADTTRVLANQHERLLVLEATGSNPG